MVCCYRYVLSVPSLECQLVESRDGETVSNIFWINGSDRSLTACCILKVVLVEILINSRSLDTILIQRREREKGGMDVMTSARNYVMVCVSSSPTLSDE